MFVRTGGTWSQEAYLKAANAGADDTFGSSVALDGKALVVGAVFEGGDTASTAASPNDLAARSGAAYVFDP